MENTLNFSNSTGGVTSQSLWNIPMFIEAREVGETIEFFYKETSMITYAIYPPRPPEERVFKIIFSCEDGKWNKSDRIYGQIIPAQSETYKF